MEKSDAITKAEHFAETAYTAALEEITAEVGEKIIEARQRAAASNNLGFGLTTIEATKLHGERLSKLLDARLESFLEGVRAIQGPAQ